MGKRCGHRKGKFLGGIFSALGLRRGRRAHRMGHRKGKFLGKAMDFLKSAGKTAWNSGGSQLAGNLLDKGVGAIGNKFGSGAGMIASGARGLVKKHLGFRRGRRGHRKGKFLGGLFNAIGLRRGRRARH